MPWEQEVCPCVHAMTCTVTRAAVSPYSGQRRGLASSGFLADVLPVCPHLRGTVPRERVHGRSLHPVLVGVHRTPSSWGVAAPHPPWELPHPVLLGDHHTPSSWGITTLHPPGGSPHPILVGVCSTPSSGVHCTPSSWGITAPHPPGESPHPVRVLLERGGGSGQWPVQTRLAGGSWTCGAAPCPRARDCDLTGKGSLQM